MPGEPRSRRDVALFVFLLGLVVLVSPLRAVWTGPGTSWWTPFWIWGGLIGLIAWSANAWGRDER